MNRPHIELKNASLGYQLKDQSLAVLENVNLVLKEGDFVGLVGLNGAGKSTLIRSLSGALSLLKGEVIYEGSSAGKLSPSVLSKKIALVLTGKIEGFNLTVYDLVASGQMPYTGLLHRLEAPHLKAIEDALEKTGIQEWRHKKLHELSDGMYQKAIIAKALAQQTPVILMDEPAAFLDYGSKHRLFAWLKELTSKEKKCVVLSSHDLNLVTHYCPQILLLSSGKVEMMETSQAVVHPDFLNIGGSFL